MNDDIMARVLDLVAPSHGTLTRLALDRNKLTRVPDQVSRLPKMTYFSMYGNPVGGLANGSLTFAGHLTYLGLQNSTLTSVAADAFSGNFSGTYVGLQSNLLSRLPSDVYADVLQSMTADNGYFAFGGSKNINQSINQSINLNN